MPLLIPICLSVSFSVTSCDGLKFGEGIIQLLFLAIFVFQDLEIAFEKLKDICEILIY